MHLINSSFFLTQVEWDDLLRPWHPNPVGEITGEEFPSEGEATSNAPSNHHRFQRLIIYSFDLTAPLLVCVTNAMAENAMSVGRSRYPQDAEQVTLGDRIQPQISPPLVLRRQRNSKNEAKLTLAIAHLCRTNDVGSRRRWPIWYEHIVANLLWRVVLLIIRVAYYRLPPVNTMITSETPSIRGSSGQSSAAQNNSQDHVYIPFKKPCFIIVIEIFVFLQSPLAEELDQRADRSTKLMDQWGNTPALILVRRYQHLGTLNYFDSSSAATFLRNSNSK